MTITARKIWGMAMLGAAVMLLPVCAVAEERPSSGMSTEPLAMFSKGSQALYKKVTGTVVRVKVDQGAGLGGMPRELMKEFEAWRAKQVEAGAGSGAPAAARRKARAEGDGATTAPAHAGGGGGARPAMFQKFIEQKLRDTSDPAAQARLRQVMARMQAARNGVGTGQTEVTGVVIDEQGHALMSGWTREFQSSNLKATIPDGTEMKATYVGAHMGRGMAVLKLDTVGTAGWAPLATERPSGGEMLMMLSSRQGTTGWVTAPSEKKGEERFAVVGDERGGMYLFNTQGELAAIGIDRWALPVEAIKADIDWIIKNNKDIPGLGLKYEPITPELRKSTKALGELPAVVVADVIPGSPADKGKLKKGDILVTVDGHAMDEGIRRDLATKTGAVQLGIIRDGKEMTINLPLGRE